MTASISDFPRITVQPDQMGGIPCIRGLRMPVATVVRMVANGLSVTEILQDFPTLEAEDIIEALRYAAELAEQPTGISGNQALKLVEKARRNANLADDEAMNLAVSEGRAYRTERAKRAK